ncbi:hypothetical protein KUTeg_017086 [Tegillarca granosa]|uniref:C2H2-type domain-containing protein n=1 Tax=Tegillarca granosa TaxID=220873 RepID=A0ABQ9EQA8_TEGGR|nr:hypothetical protein KUTeg_017086 [Tegillarca granosa]
MKTMQQAVQQDDEYDAFDMEVDEVDEEEDMYDREEESEASERVIVPRSKTKSGLSKMPVKTVTSTMVTVTPSNTAPANSSGKTSSTVTVSSGLCWNCGYCDFVTLSQTFLKTHLNTQHAGKAHKYVAMLVSSQEEMNKIKERDAQMYQNPNPALLYGNISRSAAFANVPTVTAHKNMNQSPISSAIETSASYDDSGDEDESLPESEKKKYPLTYKCAHCNFNAPVSFKIKEHLQIKHIGCVLYALDMRAVKLKQRRYVFFCHRKNCSFTSKKTEEYLNHSESCTPWLLENCPEPVDANTKKCLELTRSFSQKISQKVFSMAKNFKTNKSAEYACIHCSYTSNNNTRVKKHILSNHKDSDTTMRDLQANKMNKKQHVFFCRHCLWETREGGELAIHLKERHNEENVGPIADPPSSMDERPLTAAELSTPEIPRNVNLLRVKFEPSRGEASPSSIDSSLSPSPSEEYTEKDEEDYIDDLEVPEEDVRNLMDLYIADEASRGGNSPGRPTREAAARASIRVRAQGQQPPLYRCIHCHSLNFGVNLTRKHIRIHHPEEAYRAMDIKKKNSKQACYFCFCPKDGCHFANVNEEAVINHAVQEHKYRKEEEELQRLQVLFNAPAITSPHSKTYEKQEKHVSSFECIYCSQSFVRASMEKLRQHIHTYHPGEEVIFRDCVARKLRKTSRCVYVRSSTLHV